MTTIWTRRTFLLSSLIGGALVGCGQPTSTPAIAALEIDPHTTCDLDGMLLIDYAGPKAQIFYAGQSSPRFFCDTIEMFHTILSPEQVKPIKAIYVQDMGKADWDQPLGHWVAAENASYVLGSKRHGSMGPTIGSFAHVSDAKKFAANWGGKLLAFSEIKADMVDLSGGALHDSRM